MKRIEDEILKCLIQFESAVGGIARNPEISLADILKKLDELTRQLPKDTDPRLLHYMHKKSYQKARLWLEGRESENQTGSCMKD